MVELSSRITNKESLGQNWGLSTVSGTGVSAGERSTVKSRSRGRAQGQLARRLVTDKLDAHRRLIDTLSETVHTLPFLSSFLPYFLPLHSLLSTYLPLFIYFHYIVLQSLSFRFFFSIILFSHPTSFLLFSAVLFTATKYLNIPSSTFSSSTTFAGHIRDN